MKTEEQKHNQDDPYKQPGLKNFFKEFPLAKWILIGGVLYGALYLSRYFINASAETIRAYKNLRSAMKGKM